MYNLELLFEILFPSLGFVPFRWHSVVYVVFPAWIIFLTFSVLLAIEYRRGEGEGRERLGTFTLI